jgi:hypothetical protein
MSPVYINDSAPLEASIFGEDGVTPITPTSASWEISRPDGGDLLVATAPTTPAIGDRVIVQEGATISGIPQRHVIEWNGSAWIDLGAPLANFALTGNTTDYLVPTQATYLEGVYHARAKFILADGSQRSQFLNFEVVDPLEISTTDIDKTIDLTWMMLEDCFDSDLGGPYLRDVTLANFDKRKLALLSDNALMAINLKPPAQNFTSDNFPYASGRALYAKALLIEAIKHLMRSYVEQPNVLGSGQISYFDRRDYEQRWQAIYQLEYAEFTHWLALWKRGFYNFGSGSLLIDMKSGRRQMYPQIDRARGRYWY